MNKQWIKNRTQLAGSKPREIVLDIIEAGLDAVDTAQVIRTAVRSDGQTLHIKDQEFDLTNIENIYVVGFGKPSCLAAAELDDILGSNIKGGVAIGLAPTSCEYIDTYAGTHPHPSVQNVEVSEKILDLAKKVTEKDLVIVIVSGGGSALLCWPMKECQQAMRLYDDFLKTGGSIQELNTVRKHLSALKGGGLAKELYPAKIIGLIFSDVPGNQFDYIASGPTYKDITTITDAQAILDKYALTGYELNETPNEDIYFENVTNIPLVSNDDALRAMKSKAEQLGFEASILSEELYDSPAQIAQKFLKAAQPGLVLLAGGEAKAVVTSKSGTGGRCERLGIEMLPLLTERDVFAAIASDGLDNSPLAGVIEDAETQKKTAQQSLDIEKYKAEWDSLGFYNKIDGTLIDTGPTQANVSDLLVFLRI